MARKRPASRADHKKFCEREGWTQVRNARGKKGSHHLTYELVLDNGEILRTRISHPPNRSQYGPSLWQHILRDQLRVSESEFWVCVERGELPPRTTVLPAGAGIPAAVVYQLITTFHRDPAQVAKLTKDQAIQLLAELRSGG